MSGYVWCACRDCFDVAITGDDDAPALCPLCEQAGCEINNGECQRPDAYGTEEIAREDREYWTAKYE